MKKNSNFLRMMLLAVTSLCLTASLMAQSNATPASFEENPSAPMLRAGNIPMQKRQGDVNADGQVNMDDLTVLINVLLTSDACPNGDVNESGDIGMDDLTMLINMLLTGSGNYAVSDAQSALDDIYYSMRWAGWTTTSNTHHCFGITAYNLMAEVMGEDMIMGAMGSGWFWYDAAYNEKHAYTSTFWRSHDLWNAYYTWIANANYIIATSSSITGTSSERRYVLGQAYAIRGYSYFMLAQSFARTYKGHENDPCVPLFEGTYFTGSTGQPRSTVAQVYAQIDSDMNQAITMLNYLEQQNPSHIGYAVAQGLRSRIALVEEDWDTAYSAAMKAIDKSGKSVQDVSDFMGMNDVDAGNVIWGAEIPAEESGLYASLFAHMSVTVDAYGTRAPKQISKWLYNKMSSTDARLAWWDPTSPYSFGGYAQMKFDFSDPQTKAGDYIYMRIEEMYLNAAEAVCHKGVNGAARSLLMQVMSKRDSNYICDKSGAELGDLTTDETGSLLEEILIQRRLELWGEDGRIYTIRRLRQGFERNTDYGWPAQLASGHAWYDPECYAWVFTIPQSEFNGNPNMDLLIDQNPIGDYPGAGQHISFADAATSLTTVKSSASIQVTLTRATARGQYRGQIIRTEGDTNFGNSYSVQFADGQASTTVLISVDDMELNHDYSCVYSLSPLDVATGNPELGEQISSMSIDVHCVNGDPTGQHISFLSETQQFTTDDANEYIVVPLSRNVSVGEYRATVILVTDEDNISLDSDAIIFNDGNLSANAYLTFLNLEKGKTYSCELRLSDADVATAAPNGGPQYTTTQITVTRTNNDWVSIGFCTYTSNDFWGETYNLTLQRDGNTNRYRMLSFMGEGYNVVFTIEANNELYIQPQPSFDYSSYGQCWMRGYASGTEGYAGMYDPNTKTANLRVQYYVPDQGQFGVFDEVLTMP